MANVINLVEVPVVLTAGSVSLYDAAGRIRAIKVQPHNAAPTTSPEAPA